MKSEMPQVLGDWLLIELDGMNIEDAKDGHIIIPAKSLKDSPPHYGTIVAIGDGSGINKKLHDAFENGNRVFIGQFQGQKVELNRKSYQLCEAKFVFMVIP